MAIFKNNPPIVTNGLVLYLDAANQQSYPGTGTTWNDLSGNGFSGTLVNGPTFNSGNGGSIVFDGNNDFVTISKPSSISNYTISLTLQLSNNFNSSSTETQFLASIRGGTGTHTYLNFVAGSGTFRYRTFSPTDDLFSTRKDWDNITQYTIDCSLTNQTLKTIYINGILDSQSTLPSAANMGFSLTFEICRLYTDSNYFQGRLHNFKLYNRALSASEIQQNYNATKTRFGLT